MSSLGEIEAGVEALSNRTHQLSGDVRALDTSTRSRTRALWFAVIAGGIVLAVAIVSAAVVLRDNRRVLDETQRQVEANNLKFCPIIEPFVVRPGDQPSTTPRGQEIAKAFEKIAADFKCQGR